MNILLTEWGEIMGIEFKDEHLMKIVAVEQQCEDNARRLEKVEEKVDEIERQNHALYEITASVKTLADGIGSVKKDVREIKDEQSEMKTQIQNIENNPVRTKAKWFDAIGKLIVTAVVSGVAAFILGQICPSIFGG